MLENVKRWLSQIISNEPHTQRVSGTSNIRWQTISQKQLRGRKSSCQVWYLAGFLDEDLDRLAVPYWVRKKMGLLKNSPKISKAGQEMLKHSKGFPGEDEEIWKKEGISYPTYIRGKHYEYRIETVADGHTHTNAVLKRELTKNSRK
ncbi:MAG: hypothetical protein Q7J73_08620 [Dehalococcoidales bacterium]|nr:hypothetical protein [Dehalococcoidales bacterium]